MTRIRDPHRRCRVGNLLPWRHAGLPRRLPDPAPAYAGVGVERNLARRRRGRQGALVEAHPEVWTASKTPPPTWLLSARGGPGWVAARQRTRLVQIRPGRATGTGIRATGDRSRATPAKKAGDGAVLSLARIEYAGPAAGPLFRAPGQGRGLRPPHRDWAGGLLCGPGCPRGPKPGEAKPAHQAARLTPTSLASLEGVDGTSPVSAEAVLRKRLDTWT